MNEVTRRIEAEAAERARQDPALGPVDALHALAGRRWHYNRSGEAITASEWALLCDHPVYRQVAETFLADGRVRVSTVWLGLDHGFGEGPPVIFETMVFDTIDRIGKWPRLAGMEAESARTFHYHADVGGYQLRYCTEVAAVEGHARVVAEVEVAIAAFGVDEVCRDEEEP